MATARRRRGRPGEERVAVRDLRPGAAAGRGLRLPSGATVALGTPLSGDQVEVLRSVAPQATVPILTRSAVRAVALDPRAVEARAEILQGVLRANLPPWPAAGRAVRPQVGEDAAVALELAVATAAWLPPAAEILLSSGLSPRFLGHGMATALLGAVTASALDWHQDVCFDVALAGLFADIGMVALPWDLVRKPGLLTHLERRAVERHAAAAAELLAPLARAAPLVPLVAQQHHERIDGAGYPSGLAGRHVRPESQVIAVAHRYLAATAGRCHREAVPPHRALADLAGQCRGLATPAIVEAFVASIAPYPPGSYVRLADGRAGRVRAVGVGTLELTVVVDADGTAIAPSDEAVGLEEVAAAT